MNVIKLYAFVGLSIVILFMSISLLKAAASGCDKCGVCINLIWLAVRVGEKRAKRLHVLRLQEKSGLRKNTCIVLKRYY